MKTFLRITATLLIVLLGSWSTSYAATILLTNSSDTISTFRTNVNTSLTNLNDGLATAGIGDPFTHVSVWSQTTSATSTLLKLSGSPISLAASSTAVFSAATTTNFQASGTVYLTGTATTLLSTDSNGKVIPTTVSGGLLLTTASGNGIQLATIAANSVLANGAGATAIPTAIATSTLYGTGTGGQVLMWSNTANGLVFAATSTSAGGASFGQALEIDAAGWLSATTTNYGLNASAQGTKYGIGIGGQLFAYASSTNETTILGLNAGGQTATTSATVASNVVVGFQSGTRVSGSTNVLVGVRSGQVITTGSGNVAVGYEATKELTTGTFNTAVGYQALSTTNTTGSNNTAIGYKAAYALSALSSNNTCLGTFTCLGGSGAQHGNTMVGYQVGQDVTTGYGNLFLGQTLNPGGNHITTGDGNIFLGTNIVGTSTNSTMMLNIGNSFFGTMVATSTSTSLPTSFTNVTFGIASSTPTYRFSLNTAGTEFYVDSNGKIVGRDTTNGWIGVLSPTRAFGLSTATTTTWTATTSGAYVPYITMPFSGTLRTMNCTASSTNAFLGVAPFINAAVPTPSYVVASSTVGTTTFSAGNTFNMGDRVGMYVGTSTAHTALGVSCTFRVTETP